MLKGEVRLQTGRSSRTTLRTNLNIFINDPVTENRHELMAVDEEWIREALPTSRRIRMSQKNWMLVCINRGGI